jgi:hypothetical protein
MSIPRFLSFGVLLALLVKQEAPQPVAALVYSLAGEASLQAPGTTGRPVRLFDRLAAGTSVEVGPDSRLELAFQNGRRYELGERSRVTVGAKDLVSRSGNVGSLPSVPPLPRLSPIAAEDRPGPKAGAVRIRAERIQGLYPCRGATTLPAGTVLRFQPVPGAGRYRIEAQDTQGRVVFRAETVKTETEVPDGILHPGTRYHWTVRTVDRPGSVARGEADFVTLSGHTAREREELRSALTAEGRGESLALLAAIDRSLGLLLEARWALEEALARSPGDSSLAEELAALEKHGDWR